MRNRVVFLLASVVVFCSRLPFLLPGYGIDPDGVRVALVARNIALTGRYFTSRFPGFPVSELVYALVWRGGPPIMNGLTAVISALGVASFVVFARKVGYRDYFLAGLALAFVPIVYISSTNAMDYAWGLAFILMSLCSLAYGHVMLAGVLLGLAVGCRITSGAMLLPLALILWQSVRHWRPIVTFVLVTLGVSAICFSPVVLTYGLDFFRFYDYSPLIGDILRRLSFDVWGSVGVGGIGIACVLSLLLWKQRRPEVGTVTSWQIAAWILAVGLYLVAYFRLPHEAGYLIPTIPFVILLLGRFLDRRLFWLVCVSLLTSPFVSVTAWNVQPGSLLQDHQSRIAVETYIPSIISRANRLDTKAVVVVGSSLPHIQLALPQGSAETVIRTSFVEPYTPGKQIVQVSEKIQYAYALDQLEANRLKAAGYRIFYVPGVRESLLRVFKIDLADFGATPLP